MFGGDYFHERKGVVLKISLGSEMEIVFHNVGQGLFTSGNCGSFRYVYDCGTNSWQSLLDTRISEFIQSLGKTSTIEALIMSHMHSDHTSGLDKLLSRVHVDTVYLPYLLPSERIVIGWQEKEFLDTNPWFSVFLIDPANWFFSRGVNSVVFFRQRLPENPESNFGSDNDSSNESDSENRPKQSDMPGASLISQLEDDAKLMNSYLLYELSTAAPANLYFKKHNNRIESQGSFMEFYNVCTDPKKVVALENAVKKLSGSSQIDQSVLKTVLKSSALRKTLKKAYENISKELNNTSLCSLLVARSNGDDPAGVKEGDSSNMPALRRELGLLLTGDISLKTDNALDEFADHYKGILNSTIVFQVPHHGSKDNWNNRLLEKVDDAVFWIASASKQCFYGHPSSKVIASVASGKRLFLWVDEENFTVCRHSCPNKVYLADCVVAIDE